MCFDYKIISWTSQLLENENRLKLLYTCCFSRITWALLCLKLQHFCRHQTNEARPSSKRERSSVADKWSQRLISTRSEKRLNRPLISSNLRSESSSLEWKRLKGEGLVLKMLVWGFIRNRLPTDLYPFSDPLNPGAFLFLSQGPGTVRVFRPNFLLLICKSVNLSNCSRGRFGIGRESNEVGSVSMHPLRSTFPFLGSSRIWVAYVASSSPKGLIRVARKLKPHS